VLQNASSPNEILLNISNGLFHIDDEFHTVRDKDDLLALRLTCRRLADFCQSLVFKHINLSHSEGGFERLVRMTTSKHIWASVQGITYDLEDFGIHITTSECAEILEVWEAELTVEDSAEFKADYAKCQDRDPLEESNIDTTRLAVALRHFHRLRSIRLIRDLEILEGWRLLDSPFTSSRVGHQSFEAITSALAVSGHKIEELVIGSYSGPSLRGVIQGLALSRSNLSRQVYGSLKRLKVELPGVYYERDGVNYAGISVLIQSAPLLEDLELEAETYSDQTVPDDFFQPLVLHNLQSLRLDLVCLQSSVGLIRFFRKHRSTLRKVDFESLLLETGSWETVVIEMRELNLS
jgi:hypothetical protein